MPTFTEIERTPGVYRARFVNLDTDYRITDKETGEEVVRWRWVYQEVSDPTTVGEMDTITSTSFKPRTNGRKFLTGMLGREPREGDSTDALIGQEFDVTYGPNQAGRLTIVGVNKPVPRAAQDVAGLKAVPTPAPAETATFRGTEVPVTDPTALPDELPF